MCDYEVAVLRAEAVQAQACVLWIQLDAWPKYAHHGRLAGFLLLHCISLLAAHPVLLSADLRHAANTRHILLVTNCKT
jgi:hypothetical protein